MPISNQPPKGTADWFPEEFAIRKYIFDTWRKVCLRYGYEEYLAPLVESAEVYRAKSGEDIGGKELVTFTDLGGRELSIRPEMTPSVTRMITHVYDSSPKPLRYFSIANFMRNEKPQRGRNREFWQLNVDLFGSDTPLADLEICNLALDIMLAFNPPANSFSLCLNHRDLIDAVLNLAGVAIDNKTAVVRILDKYEKLALADFEASLKTVGVSDEGVVKMVKFLQATDLQGLIIELPDLQENTGVISLRNLISDLESLGYGKYLQFKPSVIRGFDYYDGVVFEIFDNHPDNNRALFGGGRYNGLAGIFGSKAFPAIGFAPGDETLRLFLESWGIIDQVKITTKRFIYYLPLLEPELKMDAIALVKLLRAEGHEVIMSLEPVKMGKAMEYANKKQLAYVIIYGGDEKSRGVYKVKDMNSGKETEEKLK